MVLSGVEHHVVQGTKVLLQCIVYGARPAANITWFNGTELMREDLISTTSAVKVSLYMTPIFFLPIKIFFGLSNFF